MDMQFRSPVYGHMPGVADAFIKPIKAMTDRRASLERVGARSNPMQHACSICQALRGTTWASIGAALSLRRTSTRFYERQSCSQSTRLGPIRTSIAPERRSDRQGGR
jgi:hypothetical protein